MNAKARLGWVKLYEQIGHAGIVCRRCGISAPTLRKWWRRYQAEGEAGLVDRSRRPHHSPQRRVFEHEEQLILALRRERKLGIKRLRIELIRQHGLRLALDTIHKVLVRHGENHLKRQKLQRKKKWKRYSRPVPGDRVQMDVCKIAKGLYQFTAIDDCSRYQVAALFPRKTAKCTLAFLDQVAKQMPFPIQRIQTDRGQEFFAHDVQDRLKERHIKFRPTKPRPPHLNGKVERVQRTALEEFWPTVALDDPSLSGHLAEWLNFYNRDRPHDSLSGKAPIDRFDERRHLIPAPDVIEAAYNNAREPIRINDYAWDKLFNRSKP